MLCKHPYIKS